jgi:hypothetical protein
LLLSSFLIARHEDVSGWRRGWRREANR